jgi:SOS-response transcriptional repressor LexA
MNAHDTDFSVICNRNLCAGAATEVSVAFRAMNTVDQKAFGLRVEKRRLTLKMSQEALAQLVGMKQQGINSIEKGEVARPRLLNEIARTLKTSEEWLLWKKGPEVVESAMPADYREVPLLSWVSAGRLAEATAPLPVQDVPLLAFADLGRGDFFALKVQGDSMDRISPDGSIVVIDRADRQLVSGRFYVFSLKGDATYKMWRPDPPRLAPFSTNPMNEPHFVKGKRDFAVVGRVKRTVLDL